MSELADKVSIVAREWGCSVDADLGVPRHLNSGTSRELTQDLIIIDTQTNDPNGALEDI